MLVLVTCTLVHLAFQISRQIKGHEGSVFCMCERRSGSVLTGGGKDRRIILWDHELRADRDIEVGHSHTLEHKPLLFDLRMTPFVRSCVSVCVC